MTREVYFNPTAALCGLSLILLALLALHELTGDHGDRADWPSHAACCEAITNWSME